MITQTLQKWKKVRLNDLGSVERGRSRHRPRNDAALYGGEYPFIQTGDVKDANLYISSYSQTYNETGLAQSRLWEPNTLCITIAANIAESAILKIPACFPDSIVGFRSYEGKSDVRFVKYLLDVLKTNFQLISKGTTQDNLSLEKILSIAFQAPEFEQQKTIADFLSAYDYLIENNTRRIQILEQTLIATYNEWFVSENSNQNIIRIGTLADISQLIKMKYEEKRDHELPLVDMARIRSRNLACSEYGSSSDLMTSRIIFEEGDILFGSIRTYLHKVMLAPFRGITNTSVLVFRPVSESYYTFLTATLFRDETIQWTDQYSTGTKMPVIKGDLFMTMPTPIPTQDALDIFEMSMNPVLLSISNLSIQNLRLKTMRDLLLPKLINGEIKV